MSKKLPAKKSKTALKKPPKKKALGRGLSALMQDISVPAKEASEKPDQKTHAPAKKTKPTLVNKNPQNHRGTHLIAIDKLERNPSQPRCYFDKEKLAELTASIKDKGVLQPILVRPLPKSYGAKVKTLEGRYQIVAGERRWQASLLAGLSFMPALVRELSDQEVLEIGVVENVQRANLNPIEEALAYQALKDEFGRRQEDIASAVGKSRSHVANCMRLLSLPEAARAYLASGKITAGHARAILSAPDPHMLTEAILTRSLSVREAEKWVRKLRRSAPKKTPHQQRRDADTQFIENQLSAHIGLGVSIKHNNPNGQILIKYKTLEELEDLIGRLRKS